jgi:DNA topoisomerase-2
MADQGQGVVGIIEQTYKKLSPIRHVLELPDSYVGSIDKCTEERFVLKEDKSCFEFRSVESLPAFFKIFDEIIVNARDAKVRDASVKKIQIVINSLG